MKDLLIQNFVKKYTQKLDMQATVTSSVSVLIAKVISQEVETFMEREKDAMNQKSLRQLEKDIENILAMDPRVGPFLKPTRNGKRDMSLQPTHSTATAQ
jgi:hypothetical protein